MGFLRGWAGGFQITATPKPINHNASSVGRSRGDPQGYPLSTRTASGRPQRVNVRRNMSRIAVGGTFCQRPGGKRGGQQGPRGLVGEGQPTNTLAAGQPDSLLGIDLPDLMGHGGSGSRWGGRPWRSRAIDSSPAEGLLEGANRGHGLTRILLAQLDTNDPCPPRGVIPLQGAGGLEQCLGGRRVPTAAAGVVRVQRPCGVIAVPTAEATDGGVRQKELGGNLHEAQALIVGRGSDVRWRSDEPEA